VASLASAGSCPAVISAEAVKSVMTASGNFFMAESCLYNFHIEQIPGKLLVNTLLKPG
jgi:hypothetical protein